MDINSAKKIGTSVTVLLIIVALSLIPWTFAAFTSLFAFDAPGSENEIPIWLLVVPVWIYPLVAAGCIIGSIVLKRKNKLLPALIVIIVPLAAIVLWIICTGIYLALQPR